MKLVIKLLDDWCVLPWFQSGTDAAHSFHEVIGTILGNEVHNTRKRSRAFIDITRLHVGCTKIQFGHCNIYISVQESGLLRIEIQRFADHLYRIGRPAEPQQATRPGQSVPISIVGQLSELLSESR